MLAANVQIFMKDWNLKYKCSAFALNYNGISKVQLLPFASLS